MTRQCGAITVSLCQVRYFAMMAVVGVLTYFTFPAKRNFDTNSTTVVFLHLLSFAFHFGAQCWVTFIAGLTMFYSLPRIHFGHLQSRLFPVYFASTLILSCVTFVTYAIRHPYETWTPSDLKQASILLTCVVSTFINTFFIAPELVNSMVTVFEIEKDYGTSHVVGHVDREMMKKNPDYKLCYRKFRMNHGMSAIANIVTLICNTMYLYHLACLCVYLSVQHCEK